MKPSFFSLFKRGRYYIKQPPKKSSENYRRLRRATRTAGSCLAWFGYEYNKAGKTNKVVWFYLNDEKKRDALNRRLSKRFTASPKRDDGAYCVYVSSPLKQSERDFEWFQSVVDFAIKK